MWWVKRKRDAMRTDLAALTILFNAFISDLSRAKFRNPDLTILLTYVYYSKLIITLLSQIATNHTLINRYCHVSSFHKFRITDSITLTTHYLNCRRIQTTAAIFTRSNNYVRTGLLATDLVELIRDFKQLSSKTLIFHIFYFIYD